jgi:hypothetical protein
MADPDGADGGGGTADCEADSRDVVADVVAFVLEADRIHVTTHTPRTPSPTAPPTMSGQRQGDPIPICEGLASTPRSSRSEAAMRLDGRRLGDGRRGAIATPPSGATVTTRSIATDSSSIVW